MLKKEKWKCPQCGKQEAHRALYNPSHIVHRCYLEKGDTNPYFVGSVEKINGQLIFTESTEFKNNSINNKFKIKKIVNPSRLEQIGKGLKFNGFAFKANEALQQYKIYFVYKNEGNQIFPYDLENAFEWQYSHIVIVNKYSKYNRAIIHSYNRKILSDIQKEEIISAVKKEYADFDG